MRYKNQIILNKKRNPFLSYRIYANYLSFTFTFRDQINNTYIFPKEMLSLVKDGLTPVCRPDEPVPARGHELNQLLSL
jgi:hypothetical protein